MHLKSFELTSNIIKPYKTNHKNINFHPFSFLYHDSRLIKTSFIYFFIMYQTTKSNQFMTKILTHHPPTTETHTFYVYTHVRYTKQRKNEIFNHNLSSSHATHTYTDAILRTPRKIFMFRS